MVRQGATAFARCYWPNPWNMGAGASRRPGAESRRARSGSKACLCLNRLRNPSGLPCYVP